MTKPSATESPPITPPKLPPDPLEKKLILKKPPNGKWELKLIGPIKRTDINHLRRFLQIEYIRAKRKERLAASTAKRKELNVTESKPQ